MATISIKQNNVNFTVDNTNTPKSWTIGAGNTFAPSDLGTNFNLNTLKSAETEGWLNDLRIFHGLLIDWDGGKITLNGTTYTITNTGQLLAAIQNANKTYDLGNYSGKLSTKAFTNKYNDLLNRINNLPIPTPSKKDIIISGKSITGLSSGNYLNYGTAATITFTTSVPCTVQLVPESNSRYNQSVTQTGNYTHKIRITNTNTTDYEYEVLPNWVVIKVAASYVDASQYNVENGYAYLSDGTNRGTQYGIGYDILMQPQEKYGVYYYDSEFGGVKISEDPQQVKIGQTITLWPAYGEDENYRFTGWKNKATNTIYQAGARLTITSSMISGSSISFYAMYEEIITYTYVEPEPEELNDAYVSFSGYDTISGSFTGGSVLEGKNIILPSANKNSTTQYNYTFTGWKDVLINNIYQAGSTITVWGDMSFTAQFRSTVRQYNVTLNVNNGVITNGTKTKSVAYGQTTSWDIVPNNGYILPTTVNNGSISGNRITSNVVKSSFTVTATCPEEPISYTYVEPEPEHVFSINDNYETIAWDGTKTVTATLTNGSAANTQWTLIGDTQYANISPSTGSYTKVTAHNTAVGSQNTSIVDPTITYSGGYLKCVPGQATTTTNGADKSVTLKATNSGATSGSPQTCIINIQARPQQTNQWNYTEITWEVTKGSSYVSLGSGTTSRYVTNNNHSGSTQSITVKCTVRYNNGSTKAKTYTFTVPNIEIDTSYTYVGE